MIDLLKLVDKINRANISQRDRFILLFMVILSPLIKSVTELLAAKQLRDLIEWMLKHLI
jgi:hypothetical protein